MHIDFSIADRRDDGAIRRLVASQPIPGRVVVSSQREPDYFAGCTIMGDTTVVAARDRVTHELAGIVSLSVDERWIAGERMRIGYLGQMRIADRYQGMLLGMRGFAFVRELAVEQGIDLLFTAIMAENTTVKRIYVDGIRRTFPRLVKVCDLYTCGIMVPRRYTRARDGGPVSHATEEELSEIVDLLNARSSRRDWLPVHAIGDFTGETRCRGMNPEDLLVLRSRGRAVGVAGLWDQSSFKQSVVVGYRGALARVRGAYNLAARTIGRPLLPAPGEHLSSAYASFIAVDQDDPAVLEVLLRALRDEASRRDIAYLLVGLADDDPLLECARRFPHISYRSSMYAFSFTKEPGNLLRDGSRIPHIEIATL